MTTAIIAITMRFSSLSLVDICNFNFVVRVSLAGTYPHAFKNDDGKWDGIDIRFLSLLTGKLNFKADIVTYSTTKKAFKLVT